MTFAYADSPAPVRSEIRAAHRAFFERLAGPGEWWTGPERIAMAAEARAAWALRSQPPWLRELPPPSTALPPEAGEAVRTIALDVHRLDAEHAGEMIRRFGDAAYVELVAVSVQTIAVDAFAEALGAAREPLPAARASDADPPRRSRPDGVGDIGAHVDCLLEYGGPNVGRAMSLAPDDNATFFGLVASMYAFADFGELVWKDRPLARPQVELVAARVSAINECFY